MYAYPKPLTCVTLCHHFYLLSSLFKRVADAVGVLCPNPTSSHYPDGFYCITFHTAMIFRDTYVMLE